MSAESSDRARLSSARLLLLGLVAVAGVQLLVLWATSPEAPPAPIQGIEVALTEQNFQERVLDHDGYVLVDFWYEYCPPCRRMEPVVSHLSLNYQGRVRVGKVDVMQSPALTDQFEVAVFPTLLLFRDGVVIGRWEGYGGLKEMSRWLDRQLAGAEPALPPHDRPPEPRRRPAGVVRLDRES